MDMVLMAAYARQAELLVELDKIQKVIDLLRGEGGRVSEVKSAASHRDSEKSSESLKSAALAQSRDFEGVSGEIEQVGGSAPAGKSVSPAELVEAARRIIIKAGRPLRRTELLQQLHEDGVVVGGTDKSKVLGTTLWRASDQFINLRKYGYWIKDIPYAPALYDPNASYGKEDSKYDL